MPLRHITRESLPLHLLDKGQGHKFSHGHVLVLSGGAGRSGAARLAARGALRVGAGLVTLAVPTDAAPEVAGQITALMMRAVARPDDLRQHLRDDRINAVCIGPGLGVDRPHFEMVRIALTSGRRVVLDADALTLVALNQRLFSALHSDCLLTPHGGEFARLFPDIAERWASDAALSRAEAVQQAAHRAGCTVLLKGAETVIAHPDGQVVSHLAEGARAVPWLATAGAGDVLAGLISGLIARGIAPFTAAELAVFVHVEAALAFGPGLIAEDLPEAIPAVLKDLLT